jgi:Ca2+/Na+ antiporter
MINDSMSTCRYCSVAIDPGIAALIAERQEKANQAYSDASFLRNAAVAMFVFLAVGLVLTIGYLGFAVTFLTTLILLVRWQFKFSNLLTNDPDYLMAKRSRNVAAVLVIVAVPAGIRYQSVCGCHPSNLAGFRRVFGMFFRPRCK